LFQATKGTARRAVQTGVWLGKQFWQFCVDTTALEKLIYPSPSQKSWSLDSDRPKIIYRV
jgi:hypothetical protein